MDIQYNYIYIYCSYHHPLSPPSLLPRLTRGTVGGNDALGLRDLAGHGSCLDWYTMFTDDVGVSIHGGTPIAGWFITENPFYKWMIWGYPHYWKPLGTSSTGSSPGWQNGFHMGLSKVGAR